MNLYLKNIRKSILIICLLLVGSAIYAQNSSKITIKRKNISLQEALAEVRKLTHMSISELGWSYRYSYGLSWLG